MVRIQLFCLFALLANPVAFAAERPNIVFIFADDWGWGDLGCHGHPYVKTPNIDRLAAEGTDFHRFTVASGVCSPSRTAVMTGHFPARYNIDGHFAWVPSNGLPPSGGQTLAAPSCVPKSVDYEAVCESSLVYIFSSSICGVAAVALESTLPGETERGDAGEQPRKG